MIGALREMLGSKKALATIAGAVVAVLARLGFDADAEMVLTIVGLVAAYVVGQGISDQQKTAALIVADSQLQMARLKAVPPAQGAGTATTRVRAVPGGTAAAE